MVGDRWTLVILRDLFTGKTRFSHFLESPESITTNILSERLQAMEREGLLAKRPYQNRPTRYEYRLTAKGDALLPVLQDICRWANTYIPGTWIPPESFMKRRRTSRRRANA